MTVAYDNWARCTTNAFKVHNLTCNPHVEGISLNDNGFPLGTFFRTGPIKLVASWMCIYSSVRHVCYSPSVRHPAQHPRATTRHRLQVFFNHNKPPKFSFGKMRLRGASSYGCRIPPEAQGLCESPRGPNDSDAP